MGARNVSAVFAMWPNLSPLPKVLLLWMALRSLDQMTEEGRPPRVYFDGEASLVEASGRSRRAVYDALAVLRREGAIEVLDNGRHGHRAVYKLTLDPTAKGAETRTLKGAENRTHKGADSRTEGCGKPHVKGAENRTPRNHEGSNKESREGESIPPASSYVGAREPEPKPEIDGYDEANRHLTRTLGPEAHLVVGEHVGRCCATSYAAVIHAARIGHPTPLRVIPGGAA